VFIRIEGVQHYLWRAVDQDGVVLDIIVQSRVVVTDKLRSYSVAQRQLLPPGLASAKPLPE
jgi:putative transposase